MTIEVRKPTEEEIASTVSWGEWGQGESEFDWSYNQTEVCFILNGWATVVQPNGQMTDFRTGDWVIFPKGLECKWVIHEAIRKKYKFI